MTLLPIDDILQTQHCILARAQSGVNGVNGEHQPGINGVSCADSAQLSSSREDKRPKRYSEYLSFEVSNGICGSLSLTR